MAPNGNLQAERARRPIATRYLPRLRAIAIAVVIVSVYLVALALSFTEASRRSLALEIRPSGADYLQMNINVDHVDLARSEVTTQITFRVAGKLARDAFRPSANLQLFINTVSGQRQVDLPKGQRINPIEAVFPLEGDENRYPFDQHKGYLWFFVAIPAAQTAASKPPAETATNILPKELASSADLAVTASDLGQRAQADTKIVFSASIPGLTFKPSKIVQTEEWKGLSGIELNITRSTNVVVISIITMLMMAALSIALFVIVLNVIGHGRTMENFHIPIAISLIFGLPALRNIQPGIPPPGTFGDTLVFTWAEIIAAASAVTLMANWAFYQQSAAPSPAENTGDSGTQKPSAEKPAVNILPE